MSRCFPFPPPGYVKEARPDQDAIVIKENKKDKKHRKDKKDRKDKEKKEKRDKDKEKNGEKRKEKKEKKHKHRDKKEKGRDKEDKRPSEERNIAVSLDHQNNDQRGQTVLPVGETQTSFSPLLDLEKKTRHDSNGAREMQTAERIRVGDLSVQPGKVLERNEATLANSAQKLKDRREEHRIPNGHYVNPNATGLSNGFVPNLPVKENVEGGVAPGGMVMEKQKERKDTHRHKDSDRKGDKERKSKSKDKKRKREKEKEKANANELSVSTPGKLRESDINAVDSSTDRGSSHSKEISLNHRNSIKRKEPEKDGKSNGNEIQSNKLSRPTFASHQVSQSGQRIDVSPAALQFDQEATTQRIKSDNKNLSSLPVVRPKSEMRQNVTNIALEKQQTLNNSSKVNKRLSSSARSPLDNGEKLGLGVYKQGECVRSPADLEKMVAANPATEKKKAALQHVENGRRFEYDELRQKEAKLRLADKGSQLNGSSGPKLDERASKINGGLELKKPTGGAKCERSAPGPQMDIFETRVKPPPPEQQKPAAVVKRERPAPGPQMDIFETPVKPPPPELQKPAAGVKRERPAPGPQMDVFETPVKPPPPELQKPATGVKRERPAPVPQMDIFETPVKPPPPELQKPAAGVKRERPAPGPQMDIFETPVQPPPPELQKPTAGVKRERPSPGLHKDIREGSVKPPLERKKTTEEAMCENPVISEPPLVKPPHPDLKYLDEILTIPKAPEWSDTDDQSWLFGPEDKAGNTRAKLSTVIEEPKQVWAEAMRIDSADVVALPYVIPF